MKLDIKKRILVCIDWYEPGFKAGGPIRSVANIVNTLKDDYEFYILTSAYDLGETQPYINVPLNEWYDSDGLFLKYLDRKMLSSGAIRRNILEVNPDLIYLNSLFSKRFTLLPLITARSKGYPVLLAPRGMLGGESLHIKKSKKSTFLAISRLVGLYKKVTWHASSVIEAEDIRKKFGKKARVRIAQNIPVGQKLKLDEILKSKNVGDAKFLYMSRIAPIKNLHLAIQAIKQIKSERNVVFKIYGNIEDQEYWDTFKDEIGDFGKIKIEYCGVAKPTELHEIYLESDYLILPTKHENYGHAIVEAWSNGCPVIISKNTPWKNLHVQNLGWDIQLKNFDNLVAAVQEAVDTDFTTYVSQVRACYTYFKDVICDQEVVEANRKLFSDEN
ncbi:MAG: glycosyltransferase [Crocinitomicaceae bacterium]|nr:glycosyltransferase [Crocinitomicaceae bacterium]